MRNAEQIITIISAAFGEEIFRLAALQDVCASADTDVQELACRWHQISEAAKLAEINGAADPRWISQTSTVGFTLRLPTTTIANTEHSGFETPRVL